MVFGSFMRQIITSELGETVFQQNAKLPSGSLKSIDFITLVDILSEGEIELSACLLYTSPSPRDLSTSRMPSSA